MKKIILGMMLVMGSLSFSNNLDGDSLEKKSEFINSKSKIVVSNNVEQSSLDRGYDIFGNEHGNGIN